jgi:hypothetical protein
MKTKSRWTSMCRGRPPLEFGFSVSSGGLYLISNISYEDKVVFLRSGVPLPPPVSEIIAPLRPIASSLFLWRQGQYEIIKLLADPLERHGLSVFGPTSIEPARRPNSRKC